MAEPIVGVIGGMGPEATVDLMRRVIAATPGNDDADHIRMIVDNNPKVPSRIKALIEGTGENPGPTIADMAERLQGAGADFLVIPCNTAHHYWSHAADAVRIPVWNLIEITLEEVVASVGSPATAGILASPAVRQVGLYEKYCHRYRVTPLYPQQQEDILAVIKAVKAGRAGDHEIATLNDAARHLAEAGADAIVLACTEFSVIGHQLDINIPLFDTLQVLAERIVAKVKGKV